MDDLKLPSIGKWMIAPDGHIADWLGYKLHGKHLKEPINIIFVDTKSTSESGAITFLVTSLTNAGYPLRPGHTSGYKGEIDERKYIQVLQKPGQAFSNRWYILPNNHGRIFGPHQQGNRFVFIGSFSRELPSPFTSVKHVYGSFLKAREDVTQKVSRDGGYTLTGLYPLVNALSIDDPETTGDHDGNASVLLR